MNKKTSDLDVEFLLTKKAATKQIENEIISQCNVWYLNEKIKLLPRAFIVT